MDDALWRVAADQELLIASWQLEHLGMSKKVADGKVARGDWRLVERRVYALAGSKDSPRRRIVAAYLAVGEPATITGWAALYLDGTLDSAPTATTVMVPKDRHVRTPPGGRLYRPPAYDQAGARVLGGLPVAGVDWALGDLAREVGDRDLARAVAAACRKRTTSLERWTASVEARGTFVGSARANRVARALGGELVHSGAEGLLREALRTLGERPHAEPYDLYAGGVLIAQLDVAFLVEKVDVEVDGPHHFLPEQVLRDRKRDARVRAEGWEVLRFTVFEVEADPIGVARQIIAALRRRRQPSA